MTTSGYASPFVPPIIDSLEPTLRTGLEAAMETAAARSEA